MAAQLHLCGFIGFSNLERFERAEYEAVLLPSSKGCVGTSWSWFQWVEGGGRR